MGSIVFHLFRELIYQLTQLSILVFLRPYLRLWNFIFILIIFWLKTTTSKRHIRLLLLIISFILLKENLRSNRWCFEGTWKLIKCDYPLFCHPLHIWILQPLLQILSGIFLDFRIRSSLRTFLIEVLSGVYTGIVSLVFQ